MELCSGMPNVYKQFCLPRSTVYFPEFFSLWWFTYFPTIVITADILSKWYLFFGGSLLSYIVKVCSSFKTRVYPAWSIVLYSSLLLALHFSLRGTNLVFCRSTWASKRDSSEFDSQFSYLPTMWPQTRSFPFLLSQGNSKIPYGTDIIHLMMGHSGSWAQMPFYIISRKVEERVTYKTALLWGLI